MSGYFISAEEIAEALGVSVDTGYKIIRELNAEMEKKGYRVQRARLVKSYFLERYGIEVEKHGE